MRTSVARAATSSIYARLVGAIVEVWVLWHLNPHPLKAKGAAPKSRLAARLAKWGVLNFRVYADGNYWTTTGWEDDAVSDFDEGERRGEGRLAGDACRRGEGARAAAGRAGQVVQPEEDNLRDGAVRRSRRDPGRADARGAGVAARGRYDRARDSRV